MASPDINTEDFLAAVDFLSTQQNVDAEHIGILGICGWGGMALNAAALDPRIKATVTSTMYDMIRVTANGYFDSEDSAEKRMEKRRALAMQRTKEYAEGSYQRLGGLPEAAPDGAPQFLKDYVAYYKTKRGYHKRSLNSNEGWNVTGCQSFLNQPLLAYVGEIENAVLQLHGEKAHSRYFSETAFEKMKGTNPQGKSSKTGNKELLIIPGASHCDLYDQMQFIPFDKIEVFYRDNLK